MLRILWMACPIILSIKFALVSNNILSSSFSLPNGSLSYNAKRERGGGGRGGEMVKSQRRNGSRLSNFVYDHVLGFGNMGNCIKRNRLVAMTIGNVRKYYNTRRGRRNNVVGDDSTTGWQNQTSVGDDSTTRWQNQSNAESNSNRPSPPVSGTIELIHQKQLSHPLATPNVGNGKIERNKAAWSVLAEPVEPPKKVVSGWSASCALPVPILTESEILSCPYLKAFTFEQLRIATSNYCEDSLLGEGGFGFVYKGWLDEETLSATKPGFGIPVAIKRLIPDGFQGHNEWLCEVNYLGRLHHPNLVKLIGYCLDAEDRILVYEFMPGGCVEDLLFTYGNTTTLSWARRIKIAVGAARGLCFLHQQESPVIYRDFKTSNILLDNEFEAKLSDFGLAKAGPTDMQTHVTTRVMGTEGYCDPHYLTTGKLTVKCDVYSFGVVLLELLTGRPAIDDAKFQEEKNLVNWVKLHVQDNGKVFRIMDTKLEGQYCKRSAYIVSNLALRCLHHHPKYRPPMTYMLEILENLPSYKNQHIS